MEYEFIKAAVPDITVMWGILQAGTEAGSRCGLCKALAVKPDRPETKAAGS